MSKLDLLAMLPYLTVCSAGVVLMTLSAFFKSIKVALTFTLIALLAASAGLSVAAPLMNRSIGMFLRVDPLTIFMWLLLLVVGILITLTMPRYMQERDKNSSAMYVLLLFALAGVMTIAASVHLLAFFLGLEILSVSLYGLIGYTLNNRPSLEASIKYLILAATASAALLFGIALLYLQTGTMSLESLPMQISNMGSSAMSMAGIILILGAFGFKLALVPFHMWSPDVYQGAPAPVTSLIATTSKAAVMVMLIRLLYLTNALQNTSVFYALVLISVLSMTVGNLLALKQENIKRILAYSSTAHMGYMLIPLLSQSADAASSIIFYLVSYCVTIIAAFAVISAVSTAVRQGDSDMIEDYRGLYKRFPVGAAVMTLAMLSLIGFPLTSGFFAKLYIFTTAARSGLWTLLTVGVITTGLSAYYYLRVVQAMFRSPDPAAVRLPSAGSLNRLSLIISSAIIVLLGLFPNLLIDVLSAIRF